MAEANIHAARDVALREFPLNTGYGFADYLLHIDGKAAGVIEAKREGSTLTGVEVQSARSTRGLPNGRMQEITGEHSKDITAVLQTLVFEPVRRPLDSRSVFNFHDSPTKAWQFRGEPVNTPVSILGSAFNAKLADKPPPRSSVPRMPTRVAEATPMLNLETEPLLLMVFFLCIARACCRAVCACSYATHSYRAFLDDRCAF